MEEVEDKKPFQFAIKVNDLLMTYRYHIAVGLGVFLLIGIVVFFIKGGFGGKGGDGKVEVLSASSSGEVKTVTTSTQEIVVEISGEVEKPGVYHFSSGARIDDLLKEAGDVTDNADATWIAKNINRAAKLVDGQKLYIPAQSTSNKVDNTPSENHSESLTAKELTTIAPIMDSRTIISNPSNNHVNINSASLSELDSLPGIGPVYAQKIIDHRPYSDVSELKSKKVVPGATFEKIKDKISIN